MTADFANKIFADPAATGRPGEAASWTWTSSAPGDEWATFNAVLAILAHQTNRESFEAGYGVEWVREYADEISRITDGTLTVADIGSFSRQVDTRGIYLLTSIAPITWQAIDADNENWLASLVPGTYIGGIFNGASSSYNATVETFAVWGEPWWVLAGPPWFDEAGLLRQDDPEGLAGPVVSGWSGWASWLLGVESFDEAWATDPLSSAWYPGVIPGGVMRGAELSFPLTIPVETDRFCIWDIARAHLYEIIIPTGQYTSATALAAELQASLAAQLPGACALSWVADGDRVALAWNGTTTNERMIFGVTRERESQDVRGAISFAALGPAGMPSQIYARGSDITTRPSGIGATADLQFDRWSHIAIDFVFDGVVGMMPLENGQLAAVFNAFSTGPDTRVETLLLADWFGAGATWVTDLLPGSLDAAAFAGGVGTSAEIESFETPLTYWGDNLYEE